MHLYKFTLILWIPFILILGNIHAQTITQKLYIDFGPNDVTNGNSTLGEDSNGNLWNNINNTSTNSTIPLRNQEGVATGMELTLLTGMSSNGIQHGGLLNPETALLGDFAIASLTQDYFFTRDEENLRFDNLDVSLAYRFKIFGSRNHPQNRVSTYVLNGGAMTSGSLQTSGENIGANGYNGNNNNFYYSDFVFPDTAGSIALQFITTQGDFSYINGILVEEYEGVNTVNVDSLSIIGDSITSNGNDLQLEIEFFPSNANNQQVVWINLNPSIAKLTEEGRLIPYKNGTVLIEVKSLEEGSEVSTQKEITIVNQQAQNFFFDFGPEDMENGNPTIGADQNNNYWNNISNSSDTTTVTPLIDQENNSSSITLRILDPLEAQGLLDGGLENPDVALLDEFAVNTATQDYFFSPNSGTVILEGLNPDNAYRFHLFGSAENNGRRNTSYILAGLNEETGVINTSGRDIGGMGLNGNTNSIYTSPLIFPNSEGQITVETKVALGQFAYLNAMRMTEFANRSLCPERSPFKITVMGSSVARGQGAPNDMGYAFLYNALLQERAQSEIGQNWDMSNISVGGDNTPKILNRWKSDLLPQCPSYVIYGLSLANEGIRNNGQAAFDQFRDNMRTLIEDANAKGIQAIIIGNYPRADYTATDYSFIKMMNLLIHEWDVPSVNVLGSIDNLSGRWANGFSADLGHPNQVGHQEFSYAMVPSLFDALHLNKAQPFQVENTSLSIGDALEPIISFKPEHVVHPFTFSVDINTNQTGPIANFESADGSFNLEITNDGFLEYTAFNGNRIRSNVPVNNTNWHQVTLSHYYALGQTLLYIDGVKINEEVTEQIELDSFWLNPQDGPRNIKIRDLFFYRSGMNSDEVQAIFDGKMLKSSLELYAPLDGEGVLGDNPFINLAQSTNQLSNDLSTSIFPEHIHNGYKVFPNPVESLVKVVPLEAQQIDSIQILNFNGYLLKTVKSTIINFSEFPNGIYLLNIIDSSKTISRMKLIKQ